VVLGGATITRASLHNHAHVERLDLRVGDWIEVEKAGEIIPQVARVLVERRAGDLSPYVAPSDCPECGNGLRQAEGGAVLRCANALCPPRLKLGLVHFASNQGVAIEGLGPRLIERLIEAGLLRRPGDFYRLKPEQLETVVGARTAAKLSESIVRSRQASLSQVIAGLGIPGVGPSGAKALAMHFQSLENLADIESSELEAVPGLRPAAAEALRAYLADEANREALRDLADLGIGRPLEQARGGLLQGKRFVLTGKLPGLTRREARDLIQAAGGEVSAALSESTDFVVAGENAGVKLTEAKLRGIPVLDEADLRALLAAEP